MDYDLLVFGGPPKAALADERLIVAHSFFQGLWPMVYQASSGIAAFATESRVFRLHLTCHKHKKDISFGLPLSGLYSSTYIYIYIYIERERERERERVGELIVGE